MLIVDLLIVPCRKKDGKFVGHEIDFIPIPGAYKTGGISFGDASIKLKCMKQNTKVKDEPLDIFTAIRNLYFFRVYHK